MKQSHSEISWMSANHWLKRMQIDQWFLFILPSKSKNNRVTYGQDRREANIAPRFLLDSLSGPVMLPLNAHYDIAFACIVYLNFANELIDPIPYGANPIIRVGEGFHSLQLYANAFWLDHLLDYAKSAGNQHEDFQLRLQVSQFCELYGGELVKTTLEAKSHARSTTPENLEVLRSWGGIFSLAENLYLHREAVRCRQRTSKRTGRLLSHPSFSDRSLRQ